MGPPHHNKKIYSLCATTHNSTTMSPIQDAIKEIESRAPGASFPYRALAKKYDISRNTLARKHWGLTDSYAGAASARANLALEQELELVKYIEQFSG
jgi:hypothetical protein